MFIINCCLNMFRASLCPSSGEQRPCYCIWCVVLVLLDVVFSGCGALHCRMRALLASYNILQRNEIFPPVQTGPGTHPASCKMGTGSLPGVKCGRSMQLTTHPLLVPRSWKSRAIPLPTLWATPSL
jgi:hypothetical protein